MSRRQSLDRPGILSPPGPFLTPSPSPSISASPRLQPSPSLSPFPQDALLVTGNHLTNNSTHEQERKTVTPGRRQSIHQFTNGSPSAGTVVFQPSPSQSPAAATSVIGVTAGGGLNVVAGFPNSVSQNTITTTLPTITTTGNELNTTLVGSNNIQLNKKGTKRQQQQQYQQQQQQQHHQIFSSSSHYSHLPSLSTTTTIAGGYGQLHATTVNNTPNTFATTTVASTTKNQTKKGTGNSAAVLPISQQSQQPQQQQFHYQTSSPLIADSPSPSPSGTAITSASIKPPTPQPTMQMFQQQFTISSNGNGSGPPQQQTFQLIQGPQGQIIAAATTHQQNHHMQQQQQHQQHRFNPNPTTNIMTSTPAGVGSKSAKAPQQILPKPQQLHQQHQQQQQLQQQQQHLQQHQQQQLVDQINLAQQQKTKTPNPTPPLAPVTSPSNMSQPSLAQISQSTQPGQQQQIILPSGATASLTTTAQQPLLLNQVPVLVQQNTPQGVQLILRPPTPQLTATPSLVIQNRAQPQLQQHHQHPQQVLRILGTNGATMQLAAATPTFIVSSQANLIQQANHLQTIKAQSQSPAITQLSGLHAALSAAAAANNQQQRSQQFATTASTINGHLLSPSVAAQIQNLQLAAAAAANGNGLTAQIQMPNGLTSSGATTLLSQLPGAAQFQQNSQGFNINLNQLSGANIQQIAAAAATFQTPPPPQSHSAANNGQQPHQNSGNNNTTANNTATNDLFSNSSNTMSNITQSSPAHCPVAVTPEPLRQPTPVLQNIPAASPQLTHTPPQIQLSLNAAATIQLQHHQQQQQQAQIQQLQQQIQQTQNQVQQAQQQAQHIHQVQQTQCLPQSQPQPQPVQQEAKKKPKPRKKKPPACNSSANAASANNNKSLTTTANKSLNTNTLTTSVLAPTITSTSNTIKMVPTTSQEQTGQQLISTTTNMPPSNLINQNMQDTTTTANVLKSPSPPPQIQRASNGKLDLGNVMKLCGITDEDDEDFMESTTTEEHTPAQTLGPTQNFTISIPQPNGTSETLPYTLSIPGVQSSSGQSENIESSQEPAANFVIKIDPSETGNGSVNSSVSQPYSITIPRLPSQEEIQKQSQQHLNNLQNDNNPSQIKQQQTMLSAQPLNTNITFSLPLTSTAATMPPNNNMPQLISNSLAPSITMNNNNVMASCAVTTTATTTTTATVKPRRKPAAKRNTKKDANNTAASINSSIANSMNITQNVASTSSHIVTPSSNVTTSAISTPLATPSLVPSQIGNIQISQIDNRISNNSAQLISAPMTSSVENKIQIMPIMDKNTNNAPMPHLQQTQIVFQPNNAANNFSIASTPTAQTTQSLQQDHSRQMQLVALPQLSNSSQASTSSTSNLNPQQQQQQQSTVTMPSPQINSTLSNHPNNSQNSIMAPVTQTAMLPGLSGNVSISVGTPNTIASIIPQLTGSLTLAVSEQCERLILRHDPNQPQDQQSQLILQALLKGALPNVTIINEPTKVEPPKPATTTTIQQNTIPQPMLTPTGVPNTTISSTAPNSTGAISKSNKKPNKQSTEVAKQQVTQNLSNQMQKTADVNAHSSTTNLNPLNNLNSNMNLSVNSQVPPNVTLSQQRYIALPKIDPSTQQLFSLNPLNNQITPINANQTTASIGPTERLLIAPAGINAQQLAQCLQQGQLHFNDVNPLATQQAPATQQQQQTTNLQMTQQHQQPSMSAMTANTSNLQQPKQQIVYPMTSQGMITTTPTITSTTSNSTMACSTQPATAATTSTTTKQVANVAPIIDQSKAKQDAKQINNSTAANTGAVPKKKPVRKPKASTTTAADVALMKNASVVKPMPKLDPLSQKPNNNPVQIVQPNTASGKPVVSTSTTSTTTTTSNVVTIQPFQTQTSTGTKLVGVTAPMQQQPQNNLQQQQQTQQNRTQTNFNLNFSAASNNNASTNAATNLNTNPPINTLNSGLPLNNNNTVTNGANPPANQPQHTVSRVQTIQLTPQQQQMFKQVQMQIQYLTVKLQHKNLLSSMPLPADLDPNVVAAFNKPMTDMEINTALQRLFMEQHRILAAGKEIPTPEPFITSAANAANSFSLMQSNNFNPDNGKINVGNIPSNVVQPNNHSTLPTNINGSTNVAGSATNSAISNIQQQQQQLTQKIHIYPIQHQQQAQQQNKQSKQHKQQQVILNTNNLNANSGLNNNLITPASVATGINSGNSKVTTKQKPNQAQTQQQQQIALPQTPNNTGGNNLTTTLVNTPTLNPQLPQLSSLTTTPSLPSLQYPSLPPPHMINIANMPAVLQQKHFTQHLQLQQQQLMQQQQQKLQNSNSKPSSNFTTINNLTGFQQGPPPLIFSTSASATTATNNQLSTIAVTSSTATTLTTMPQLSALSQQQQQLTLQSQQPGQIQFQSSNQPATTTFAVSIGNQKAYVPIITGASASLTSSVLQQTSVVSSSASTSINTVVSSMPQLTPATVALTTTQPSTVASSVAISTPTVMATTGPVKPLLTLAPSSSSNMPLNNSIVVQNAIFNGGINVNIVGNPIAQNQTVVKTEEQISPKAKLARLSLFLRQLEVDQQSCLNPDYKSPFQNKEEAVKRLIRYHCMYQTDEDIPSEEEEEFEKTAIRFQDKFRKLSGKFQQILLQESMLQHRTSEICQMEKLMIEDLQQEIEDSKQLEKDILQYELLQHQQEDQKDDIKDIENTALSNISNPSPCSATEGIFDEIKNEVKSEPLDSKLYIEVNSNNDSNSNFCNNLQSSSSSSSSMDSIKNEIKGEPCDNSLISSSGVKSSCSSMDSFDLLKQSPVVNSSFKKQPVEVKETKKEELSNQWKQSYMDSKNSNTFYHHLPSTAVNISKPSNHVFNGVVKKQQPSQQTTAVNTVANSEMQKDPKESFENFDIESEITPSFIMKKQEPKEPSQTPVTATTATTTTAPIQTTTTTTNTNTATTKSSKSIKQAKINHTFENNLHGPVNNQNASNFQQNQATNSTSAANTEIVTNNFDFSHLPVQNQSTTKQQEDDWLCIQKELNLINSVNTPVSIKNCENSTNNSTPQTATEPLAKALDFLSNATSNDLFPNGCINKNIDAHRQNQSQTNEINTNCGASLVASSCSQQNQQPSLTLSAHEENQQAADLNEFFSGSEDSEVQKDVETRLEAMFGESPVHLSGNKERSDTPEDIESGLESIFGEANKSPSNNHCTAKEKTNWESDFAGNSFMSSAQQHSTNFINTNNSMPHHIQLGSANNPRWMQNMEAQFPDFLTNNTNSSAVNDCMASRKRQWNGHIVDENAEHVQQQTQQPQLATQDEESPQKKMCDGSMNSGGLNDSSASSSSPLSLRQQQQQQPQNHHHHNLVPNDASHAQELMDAALLSLHDGLGVESPTSENPSQANGFAQMMGHHENFSSYNNHMDTNQQQQTQHFMNINQHQNVSSQQQQMLNNHMMQMNHHQQPSNIHGHHHAGAGEFDDDITRHVQNAIDSILNLQSSEADSLSFSLDHSMGSFLGDTILNDNQSGGNNQTSCQDASKRRHLVDELGDCLMGNSSTGPTSLNESPLLMDSSGPNAHSQLINHSSLHHNSIQQQHHGHVAATSNSINTTTMNNHHSTATGSSNISVSHTQQQQLNDFNCIVGGIDDAVKSIMTS